MRGPPFLLQAWGCDERRRAVSRREFSPRGGQRSGAAASVGGSYKHRRKRGSPHPMSLLRWIVIAVVFVVLLFVSLQNAQTVTLQVFDLYSWQAPLVFVILIAFATGVALGLLAGAIKIV